MTQNRFTPDAIEFWTVRYPSELVESEAAKPYLGRLFKQSMSFLHLRRPSTITLLLNQSMRALRVKRNPKPPAGRSVYNLSILKTWPSPTSRKTVLVANATCLLDAPAEGSIIGGRFSNSVHLLGKVRHLFLPEIQAWLPDCIHRFTGFANIEYPQHVSKEALVCANLLRGQRCTL